MLRVVRIAEISASRPLGRGTVLGAMEGSLRGVKPVMDCLERTVLRGAKTFVPIENITVDHEGSEYFDRGGV